MSVSALAAWTPEPAQRQARILTSVVLATRWPAAGTREGTDTVLYSVPAGQPS